MKNSSITISLNSVIAFVLGAVTLTLIFSFNNSIKTEHTQYEYLQISVIESVVKAGAGRSRMVSIKDNGEILEEKLENLFSISGISFKNVRFNDNTVTERISKLINEGWELENVVTGAYGTDKTAGIFLTRYLFRKTK
tara:strand:- start:466 stop:879 length:414 start_codon:yes stop_codon:yes gene_type:complete